VRDVFKSVKKKKTILCDMDGIVASMVPPWIARYEDVTGEKVDYINDRLKWDLVEIVEQPKLFLDLLEEPGLFFDNVKPFPGAVEYIQKLMDEDFDVVFVTQPPRKSEYAIRDKNRWIKKYWPDFNLKNVIFCSRKELVTGDVFIDDSPHHIEQWIEKNPDKLTLSILYGPNATEVPEADYVFEDPDTAWKQIYRKITG